MRTVLFHRHFRGFTGGHLKVWNYFNHVEAATGWHATVHFSNESNWDEHNPWFPRLAGISQRWEPEKAAALFLGGHDWRMLPPAERDHYSRPIINLIQHVHHADPAHPLSEFLSHRAVRICVSAEVREAIEATGQVNGPALVIPNGIDFGALPAVGNRPTDWLICGLKEGASATARRLGKRLETAGGWGRVETLTKLLPRPEFLAALAMARRVVLLPRATEGFYLPALEAMALGCLVICPDCVGNRSFCRDGFSVVVPVSGSEDDVFAAMENVRQMSREREAFIMENARTVAAEYTLERERVAFHELLASLPSLW